MSDHITIRVDKDYRRNIATTFSRLQHGKKFWDCKILVGSETLYCHSYIVSSLSPVIEEMIQNKIRDGSEKEITFEDIHPDVMRKITNYMYTGSVSIPNELVLEVVQVCDELKIEDLKERCLYRVPEILCPQTAMGWLKYARKHKLESISHSCERYISHSYSEITKEKLFIRCSLDELKTTLQDLKAVVSPENLLTSVLSWINYDKTSRKKALDYISGYLELKVCGKQFLTDSAKVHIDIFQSNPEFNHRVTQILHKRKTTVVVIGGEFRRNETSCGNTKGWKLGSETDFVDISGIQYPAVLTRIPTLCRYDWNTLILTGGYDSVFCVKWCMLTKFWKQMESLKVPRCRHASVCILQQVFIFGGYLSVKEPFEWSRSVEFLNIEQEHGLWQSAPPMPSALQYPKSTCHDTIVYLMGDDNPVLYMFDVIAKVWCQKPAMPEHPGSCFSIAAGNGNLYAAGGKMKICWQFKFSTDSWAKLSSPELVHVYGAMIFHDDQLLLIGGCRVHTEGYAITGDTWAVAPYILPEKLTTHYAFMMDLGV